MDASGNVAGYNDFYPFGETMPGRSMVSSADPRYQYVGVEQDAETDLYATGPRLYDPWRGGFGQTDPATTDTTLVGWSMYQYAFDNPMRFEDPTGKQPGGGDGGFGGDSFEMQVMGEQIQEVKNEFNRDIEEIKSIGPSLWNFGKETADAMRTTSFWAGVGFGTSAVVATGLDQPEIAAPLGEMSASSFTLSFRSDLTSTAMTSIEWLAGEKSGTEFGAAAISTFTGYGLGKFVEIAPISTRVVGEVLSNQSSEALRAWIKNLDLQPAH